VEKGRLLQFSKAHELHHVSGYLIFEQLRAVCRQRYVFALLDDQLASEYQTPIPKETLRGQVFETVHATR